MDLLKQTLPNLKNAQLITYTQLFVKTDFITVAAYMKSKKQHPISVKKTHKYELHIEISVNLDYLINFLNRFILELKAAKKLYSCPIYNVPFLNKWNKISNEPSQFTFNTALQNKDCDKSCYICSMVSYFISALVGPIPIKKKTHKISFSTKHAPKLSTIHTRRRNETKILRD